MENIFISIWRGSSSLKLVFWVILVLPAILFLLLSIPIYLLAMELTGNTTNSSLICFLVPLPWLIYIAVSIAGSSGKAQSAIPKWSAGVILAFLVTWVFLIIQYQAGIESIG